MSNQTDHTIVRLRVPPALKKQIEKSAEQNNRSQSAEMVARLDESFEQEGQQQLEQHLMAEVYKDQQKKIDELREDNKKLQKQLEETAREMLAYMQESREMRVIYIEALNRNFDNIPLNLQRNFSKLLHAAIAMDSIFEKDEKLENIYNQILQDVENRKLSNK